MEVRICNQGAGFPVGAMGELVELFSRGQQESPVKGFGMGLSICQRIVEAHGGEIALVSPDSGGACVVFTLPLGSPPFAVGELLARVRALLRRGQQLQTVSQACLSFADITVDMASRLVTRGGKPLHLTPIEYRLLVLLVSNAGKMMTHRQLLCEVWGPGQASNSHYLRVYVGHLRQKLERDPTQPRHILTETAVGYRFVY